jgi:hypothetical protein
MRKAHAKPACQAWMGSSVFRYTGNMTTKITMNRCGTLGP